MSEEELNFDDLVDIAITHIYRDNECSALQKIVKKQQKEIEELKKENDALEIIHKSYKEMIEENDFISKDKIRFYYKKICASVNHFQSKNDNNIVLRIKEYLEELLEENKSNENNI